MAHMYNTVAELERIQRKGRSSGSAIGTPIGTVDDSVYENVLEAVSAAIDNNCGRNFLQETGARVFESDFNFFGRVPSMFIDDVRNVANASITVETAATPNDTWEMLDAVNWWLEPFNPQHGWPYTQIAIRLGTRCDRYLRINAPWGWNDVPDPISRACLMWANRVLLREDSPYGIVQSVDFGTFRVGKIDNDIAQMLQPYKRDYLLGG